MSLARNVQNMLGSKKNFRLSLDDAAKIAYLAVRLGKVTAWGRRKTTSGVWNYFGFLPSVL